MSTIYDEALLDAKKIRETAEQAARNKIMETITPQIRDLINKRILFEEAASLDEEETTDEFEEEESEDFDVDNLVDSLPDVDLDAEEMASKEAVKRASAVTIHASGDVNIDIDADEDDEADDNEFEFDAKMAESFVRLVKQDFAGYKSLSKRVRSLVEKIDRLKTLSGSINESSLTKGQLQKLDRSFASCVNEAIELRGAIKQSGRGSQHLEEKLTIAIKEMREMSSKYKRNIFDFLFEADEAETKKAEMKKMEEADDDVETDEVDAEETETEETHDVDMDAASAALKSLGAALGLDLDVGGEKEAAPEEESAKAEVTEEGWGMEEEGGYPFEEEMMHEADEEEEAHAPKKEGKKAHSKSEEEEEAEGKVYEIDETVLRRELSRMRESRRLRESKDRVIDVDAATLSRIIAEEISLAKSRRSLAESKRPAARAAADSNALHEVAEYKQAVSQLKQQLVEMNLFNAKLLYANKLLQNKNLSVKQQRAIVEALDNAKTLREAKLLYRSLSESLSRRGQGGKVVSESVNRTLGSSSRSTRSGSPANSGVETDRWAVLAGISKN